MMADWRYDSMRVTEEGKRRTRYAYRNQCGIWAIQSYVMRRVNKMAKLPSSLSVCYDDQEDTFDVEDKQGESPFAALALSESERDNRNEIEQLFMKANVTNQQRKFLEMYYVQDMTQAAIAKQYGISRQRVEQVITKGMKKIRSIV
jgi:RNA polymerase sigma factor (sigma-70 family)